MPTQLWTPEFHLFRQGRYFGRLPVDFREAELEIVYSQLVLRDDGTVAGEVPGLVRSIMQKELRSARSGLLALNESDHSEIAHWLSSVRCFRLRQESRNHESPSIFLAADVEDWTPDNLTDDVISLVGNHRRMHAWLTSLSREDFQKRFKKIIEQTRKRYVKLEAGIDRELKCRIAQSVKVPKSVSVDLLFNLISDVSSGASTLGFSCTEFDAVVKFDLESGPVIRITAPGPFTAMNLLTFNDQTFLRRPLVSCEVCGIQFVAPHRDNKYCGPSCRDYAITTRRRIKLQLIKQGLSAWTALKKEQNAADEDDQGRWITAWVIRNWNDDYGEKPQLQPDWVEAQLKKMRGN